MRLGVSEGDIAAGLTTPDFVALLEFEIERTEAYCRDACIGVRRLAMGWMG